ncbi:hypothetical protein TPCG7_11970 [Cutibacterium granulosum]|nr:hypothetical protein TPCG7_11970 [Cutibacterium granulosum]
MGEELVGLLPLTRVYDKGDVVGIVDDVHRHRLGGQLETVRAVSEAESIQTAHRWHRER